MDDNPYEDNMCDVNIDNDWGFHWRIFFEDNDGGVDDNNALLHSKRWVVYVNKKENLIKGGIWWTFSVIMVRGFFGKW